MFDEPPEEQLGDAPVRWIGHLAGAIGVLFFAVAVYFLVTSVIARSVGGGFVTLLVGAIAAYFLVVGQRMTANPSSNHRLMPPFFYRSLCVVSGALAIIGLILAALEPARFDPVTTLPGAAATGWFAWMCYIAGWRIDD